MAIKPRSMPNRMGRSSDDDSGHGTHRSERVMYDKCTTNQVAQHRIGRRDLFEVSVDDIDMQEMEEVVSRMREKESTVYHSNCIERRDIASNELTALWRRMLINWMYYVVDCCDLQRHSVAVAAYFMDVAILRDLCKSKEEHQLAAATSLQMALKTFDTAVIKLDKLVKLGRGLFTQNDVAVMEMKIITSLDWNLHPPTIYCFLQQIDRLIPTGITNSTKDVINRLTKVIAAELTYDERYIRYYPSIQAFATIIVAIDWVSDDEFPIHLRKAFFLRLSTVMNLDYTSSRICKVTRKLYKTLNTGDKLKEIIEISTARKNKSDSFWKTLSDFEEKKKKSRDGSKIGHEQHSPRDVKHKINIISV